MTVRASPLTAQCHSVGAEPLDASLKSGDLRRRLGYSYRSDMRIGLGELLERYEEVMGKGLTI